MSAGSGLGEPERRAPRADFNELARRYRGIADVPPLVNLDAPSYGVDRTDLFWVAELGPGYFRIQAELRLITPHAYWYVQQGVPVNDASLRQSADQFERSIYPEVRRLVANEPFPGIDNDTHLTVLNGRVPGVAGYASSVDTYSTAVRPFSNERDMVYMNVGSVLPGTVGYAATLAHEFTHVAHEALSPTADTWTKEGLAEYVSSLAVPARQPSYRAFFDHPDTSLVTWSDAPARPEHYQAAELFLRYFSDRVGKEALSEFVALEGSTFDNFNAVLARFGGPSTFDALFQDWVVANALGSKKSASGPGYEGSVDGVPRVARLEPGRVAQAALNQLATDYYELDPNPQASFQFTGNRTVAALGAGPRSGGAMWFGGRADASRASMTRAFDLSGLDRARLDYSVWYDLERDYDYAYLALSPDGGASWVLLEAPGMTRSDPGGSNLRVGYTGRSGGGAEAQWVDESVDLTPYAGGPILLSFLYVTDDAVTHAGIVIDDVAIWELGFFDGAEGTPQDWQLEGWSVVGPPMVQPWSVQVIRFVGSTAEVQRVAVDSQGNANWSADGRPSDRIVVAVSPLAHDTREQGSFTLTANS